MSFASRLALPIIRWELPGWGRLASALNIFDATEGGRWSTAPSKTIRGKWHGYEMDLNLADWSERQSWFLGRYHELDSQLLMNACVRPGERVVDVGANIGMLTLHAASRVGPAGIVDCFEPNPICCDRISHALARNNISQVRLHQMALSDTAGNLTLSVLANHTGMGTLAPVDGVRGLKVTSAVNVPVQIGDNALPADVRPLVFVKMDVEGFEVHALRGLRNTLLRYRPIVANELIAQWLERAGSSVAELAELMLSLGYEGFGLRTGRRNLRHHLRLIPFPFPSVPPNDVSDVVWVPRSGELRKRLIDAIDPVSSRHAA